MKKAITNLVIISSLSLLVGCSGKAPEAKKTNIKQQTASVYSIMGIEQATLSPTHQAYNTRTSVAYPTHTQARTPIVSDDIEVIAYGSYNPVEQNFVSSTRIKDEVEWNAKSFLGTKYVWGATGPGTFDCSGFTQWVYRDVGINIPRVSRDQARVGEYINYHQLRRGDMVFFDTKKRRNGIVSHVGIYLGNGNFIHASSSAKKVVIYNFEEKPFYKKRFMWGRRVIHDNMHLASN